MVWYGESKPHSPIIFTMVSNPITMIDHINLHERSILGRNVSKESVSSLGEENNLGSHLESFQILQRKKIFEQ